MTSSLLHAIADQYGTPVYVLDEVELVRAVAEFRQAFSDFPSSVHLAYPYKANSLESLCRHLHALGMWAEVSSGMELDLAVRFGVEPQHIIYNGIFKQDGELRRALQLACKVNVDNLEELERISEIASSLELDTVRIGIRVSPASGTNWDKFGFALEDEARAILTRIAQFENLRLVGIHAHRSNIVDLEEYRKHISAILDFASTATHEKLCDLEYIDIGSGFAVDHPAPINVDTWNAPSVSDYSQIVAELWRRESFLETVDLILEPGRRIVAPSVILLTCVVSIKRRMHENIAIVDAGQNLMPGIDWYRYPIVQVDDVDCVDPAKEYSVHGCLCDSMDILGRNIPLIDLDVGDILAIECVGGYDMSRSFTWQLPRAPVVWVNGQLSVSLVRPLLADKS